MRFFIVGTGRCGSTLMQRIFNSRTDTFVFNETHWIPNLIQGSTGHQIAYRRGLEIIQNTHHVNGKPVTDLNGLEDLPELPPERMMRVQELADLIGRTFAEFAGKIYWADKTPDYGAYMNLLQQLWPESRFVHVVRNGIDVTQSMSRHPGYIHLASARVLNWVPLSLGYRPAEDSGRPTPGDFVFLWRERLKIICREAENLAPGTYLEMRFEDLLANPSETIEEVAAFLRLQPHAEWLDSVRQLVDTKRFENRTRPYRRYFHQAERSLLEEFGY